MRFLAAPMVLAGVGILLLDPGHLHRQAAKEKATMAVLKGLQQGRLGQLRPDRRRR
jgi:hypothetical protein